MIKRDAYPGLWEILPAPGQWVRRMAPAFPVLLFLGFLACQYPVGPSTLPEQEHFLIIDAELTENFGKVLVSQTLAGVTESGDYILPDPPVAAAYVLDSHGNRTDFITNGVADSTFKGVVGETYTLYVETEGKVYESTPETMRPCPELDSVGVLFSPETFRDPQDLNYYGFDVYAYLQDFAGREDFYQWDWIHYTRSEACDVILENGQEVRVHCTPYDCWGITYNTRTVVQSDQLRDGGAISRKIVRVPFATPPNKYYLRVVQRAVTPSVFAYLQSIETQTQNTGSMFDVPAQTRFNPNVSNVNDPSERILGAFSVYAYRYKVIYINLNQPVNGIIARVKPNQLPFASDPLLQAPCQEGRFRTLKRPIGWVD